MAEIDKDFYFNLENNLSIEETQIALKAYYDNFEKALNLKTSIPIFLDTNILLKYYGMSQKDKSLLLEQFFNKKRELIHITRQIEKEYQRNRLTLIQKFFEQLELLKKNFHADLREGVKNKFNRTFESEILKKDFPEVLKIVKTIHEDLKVKLFDNEELFNKIDNNVDEILEENKFLEFKDPILDVYKMFHKVPSLSKNETDFLIEQYNKLIKDYKSKKEAVKWKYAFPGCGEKKDNDKYGDYIILHEIIKFMKENNSDAIFLTADVSKADWLKKNKEPFIHYIEKVYKLTGKTLYIFDATKIIDFISCQIK